MNRSVRGRNVTTKAFIYSKRIISNKSVAIRLLCVETETGIELTEKQTVKEGKETRNRNRKKNRK